MVALNLPGFVEDAAGREEVTWRVSTEVYTTHGHQRLEVHSQIRGSHAWGTRLENVEADGLAVRYAAGAVVPVRVDFDGAPITAQLTDIVDTATTLSTVSLSLNGVDYRVAGGDLTEALCRLADVMPPTTRFVCCFTCRLADYDPTGSEGWDMRCHRDAAGEFRAARTKWERMAVPVTEIVPEFYLCGSYEPRQGHRSTKIDRTGPRPSGA